MQSLEIHRNAVSIVSQMGCLLLFNANEWAELYSIIAQKESKLNF